MTMAMSKMSIWHGMKQVCIGGGWCLQLKHKNIIHLSHIRFILRGRGRKHICKKLGEKIAELCIIYFSRPNNCWICYSNGLCTFFLLPLVREPVLNGGIGGGGALAPCSLSSTLQFRCWQPFTIRQFELLVIKWLLLLHRQNFGLDRLKYPHALHLSSTIHSSGICNGPKKNKSH